MIWEMQFLGQTIRLNVGNFTQIIGIKKQDMSDVYQLLTLYFGSKRYTHEEMISFDYAEPIVKCDEKIIKRNHFKFINIESLVDLLEQMTSKKDMLLYDYLVKQVKNEHVMQYIDEMNMILEKLTNDINNSLKTDTESTFQMDVDVITIEHIISKLVIPLFQTHSELKHFKFINHYDKWRLFLFIFENYVKHMSDPVLFLIKDLSNYCTNDQFVDICGKLDKISQQYDHVTILQIETSTEIPKYITVENIEYVNIMADRVYALEPVDYLLERILVNYPYPKQMTQDELLTWLSYHVTYLFTDMTNTKNLLISDLAMLKVVNNLYQYDAQIIVPQNAYHPLELQCLLTDN